MNYPGPIPYVTFDTNCLNSKGLMVEMNFLDDLRDKGLISIHISETMWRELPDGMGPMKEKACEYVFFGGEDLLQEELEPLRQLRLIIFREKEKLSIRDKRDVQHVFDHRKYVTSQWTFFVTNDHHFLDHRAELQTERILVGTPADCVHWLKGILPVVQSQMQQWKRRNSEPPPSPRTRSPEWRSEP